MKFVEMSFLLFPYLPLFSEKEHFQFKSFSTVVPFGSRVYFRFALELTKPHRNSKICPHDRIVIRMRKGYEFKPTA